MAAKEIYDYVSTISPDKDVTMTLQSRNVLTEFGTKNDVIHRGDDESEERIDLSGGDPNIFITANYTSLSESDAGTIMDFWFDAEKGNGKINSFKFDHPDGHTYVVRFDCNFERVMKPTVWDVANVRFKVLGRIAD